MADTGSNADHTTNEPSKSSEPRQALHTADSHFQQQPAHRQLLFEAFGQSGCAMCHLSPSATDRYLSAWIYEVFSATRELKSTEE